MPAFPEEIERTRKLLVRLIKVAGLTRAEVDASLGEGRNYSTRILTGQVELKHEHILSLLKAVGIDPADFFRLLYPRPEDRTGGGSLSRLLVQLHETLGPPSQDPDEPLPPAAAVPPSAPFDPDAIAERVAALLREDLRRKPRS